MHTKQSNNNRRQRASTHNSSKSSRSKTGRLVLRLLRTWGHLSQVQPCFHSLLYPAPTSPVSKRLHVTCMRYSSKLMRVRLDHKHQLNTRTLSLDRASLSYVRLYPPRPPSTNKGRRDPRPRGAFIRETIGVENRERQDDLKQLRERLTEASGRAVANRHLQGASPNNESDRLSQLRAPLATSVLPK